MTLQHRDDYLRSSPTKPQHRHAGTHRPRCTHQQHGWIVELQRQSPDLHRHPNRWTRRPWLIWRWGRQGLGHATGSLEVHQPLEPARGEPRSSNASGAHLDTFARDLLDVVRIVVGSFANDDVLGPSANEQALVLDEGKVSSSEMLLITFVQSCLEGIAGQLFLTVVATSNSPAANPELSDGVVFNNGRSRSTCTALQKCCSALPHFEVCRNFPAFHKPQPHGALFPVLLANLHKPTARAVGTAAELGDSNVRRDASTKSVVL